MYHISEVYPVAVHKKCNLVWMSSSKPECRNAGQSGRDAAIVGKDAMMNLHCNALLFDMDGVLIDSTPAVARVWRRWALEHGFDTQRAAGLPQPSLFLTSTDVLNGKPHPEPYIKAAAKLGFRNADCIVFEDVPAGIRAGKAAGSRVIAFRTAVSDVVLKQTCADWVLNDCCEVRVTGTEGFIQLQITAG